jgi:hypothetical protein
MEPVFAMLNDLEDERTFISVSGCRNDLPNDRLTDKHHQVLDLWEARRGAALVPLRASIRPWDMPHLLPHVAIWNAGADGDYVCRLAGTELDISMGGSLSGMALGDMNCSLIDEARHEFDAVRDRGVFSFAERTIGWVGKPYLYYRHLLLPLANERAEIHMILSLLTFHAVSERLPAGRFAGGARH